jgi:Xaa-Pro aminopeptidase
MKSLLYLYLFIGLVLKLSVQIKVMNTTANMTEKINGIQTREKLFLVQQKTIELFDIVEKKGLIVAGKSESKLSAEITKLAEELFGMKEHWHKKIVRAGINTLVPYSANPPDKIIQNDDIVILDFGPNYEGWETDVGRTYVIGSNPLKLKLKEDVRKAWDEANVWFAAQSKLTGADFFNYIVDLSKRYGYEFGGEIAGHIIGYYPHEQPNPMDLSLDIHPDNPVSILLLDKQGNKRHWVLEIHFVDKKNGIGGYYEQLLK